MIQEMDMNNSKMPISANKLNWVHDPVSEILAPNSLQAICGKRCICHGGGGTFECKVFPAK